MRDETDRVPLFDLYLTGALVVAAFFPLTAAVLQSNVMKGQLHVMEAEGRAWVGPPRIEAVAIAGGDATDLRLTFSNTGKTPTTKFYADADIVEKAEIPKDTADRCAAGKGAGKAHASVFPGATFPGSLMPSAANLASVDPYRLERLTEPYVAGCIVYGIGPDDDLRTTTFAAPLSIEDKKISVGDIVALEANQPALRVNPDDGIAIVRSRASLDRGGSRSANRDRHACCGDRGTAYRHHAA